MYSNASRYPSMEYLAVMEAALSFGVAAFYAFVAVTALWLAPAQVMIVALLAVVPISFGANLIHRAPAAPEASTQPSR
jgi:membrane protein implicated in regulation of membrane protease activity